jgi:hypothetical protein
MYIDSPLWMLKQRCPCCKEGYLMLCTCDDCKRVMAVCDEIGTVFLDPLDISMEKIADYDDDRVCPFCKSIGKIRRAKDVEIIGLGLTTKDYE